MIETARLYIRPLTYEQLVKYARNDNSLEEELDLGFTSRIISDELHEALESTILPNVFDKNKNYLYSTLWTLILKAENRMVGDLCFVGEPNKDGEIEIGYGTYEVFRGNGYMTEAVTGMVKWARMQPNIRAIIASSEKSNIPSSSVLEKNNFIKIGEMDSMYNWRLDLVR